MSGVKGVCGVGEDVWWGKRKDGGSSVSSFVARVEGSDTRGIRILWPPDRRKC